MRITLIILLFLTVPIYLFAQNNSAIFRGRIQVSFGGVYTVGKDPDINFVPGGVDYYGYQYSIQGSVFLPIDYINLGLGAGLSYRYSTNIIDIYNSSIYPKVFILFEIGNGTKRSPFSFIITPGIVKGPVEHKICFYIGGGPSFNIGRRFRKVTASITPYIEFNGGEKEDLKAYDTRMGHPGTEIDYTRHFKTITFNIACLVQLNSLNRHSKK